MQKEFLKYQIEGLIVVEGQHDVAFLSNFIDACYIVTNGKYVSRGTIKLIHSILPHNKVFLFLDPDGPGERIREIIKKEAPLAIDIRINKQDAIKNAKVGIEASQLDKVVALFSPYFVKVKKASITKDEFKDLGLFGLTDSRKKREVFSKVFGITTSNQNQFYQFLNLLKLSKLDSEELLLNGTHRNH